MKRYKPLIKEDIYGYNAFVYHRTRPDNLQDIISKGFSPGSGAMYGRGLYTTYDLDSQLTKQMEGQYGEIIIKFKVNLYNCLILDYDQAKQIYGKKYTLIDQAEVLGLTSKPKKTKTANADMLKKYLGREITVSSMRDSYTGKLNKVTDNDIEFHTTEGEYKNQTMGFAIENIYSFSVGDKIIFKQPGRGLLPEDLKWYSDLLEKYETSSDMAVKLLADFPEITKKLNGIIFTGRHDGKVCVIYNTDIALPVAYTTTIQGDKIYFDKKQNTPVKIMSLDIAEYLKNNPDIVMFNVKDSKAWTKVVSLKNIKKSLDAQLKAFHVPQGEQYPNKLYWESHLGNIIKYIIHDDTKKILGLLSGGRDIILYGKSVIKTSGDDFEIEFDTKKLLNDKVKIRKGIAGSSSDVYVIEIDSVKKDIKRYMSKIYINVKENQGYNLVNDITNAKQFENTFGKSDIPLVFIK